VRSSSNIFGFIGGPLRAASAFSLIFISFGIGASEPSAAQQALQGAQDPAVTAAPVVPQQVRYAGKLSTHAGETVEAEFHIYAAAEGGEPLWTETQPVAVGEDGSYSVLLGSTSPAGLPQTVFAGGAARWLGVSVERSAEQERALLSSVPYAMKSADAESLAGHAASDFVTQSQLAQLAQFSQPAPAGSAAPAITPPAGTDVTGSGNNGTVPLWTGANAQGNSEITQVGSEIGINEATPAATLDVNGTAQFRGTLTLPPNATATSSSGYSSNLLNLSTSVWSSTTNAPVSPSFQMFAYPVNNDTASPTAKFYMLYRLGSKVTTLLSVNSAGLIGFAPGQIFPGTVTTVTGASPVTATTTSGAVSLGLNTTALETTLNSFYAQLGAANTFTKPITFASGQTFPGTGTITGITTISPLTGTGTSGSVTLSLNTSALETTLNTKYAQLGTSNTFSGPLSASEASGSAIAAVAGIGTTGNTGAFGGSDTGFGVYGTTSSPATGTSGVFGNIGGRGVTSGSYTNSAHTQAAGVWGDSTGTSTSTPSSAGVIGTADNAYGGGFFNNSGTYATVYAENRGAADGIHGQSDDGGNGVSAESRVGAGVYSSGNTYGVYALGQYGVSAVSSGVGIGVLGTYLGPSNNAFGLTAQAGVWGDSSDDSDFGPGVAGTADDNIGGFFSNTSTTWPAIHAENTGTGTGVLGAADSPGNGYAGVLGQTTKPGTNSSTFGTEAGQVAGVWGDTSANSDGNSAGVVGTADNADGGSFFNNSATYPTVFAKNLNSGSTGLFKVFQASTEKGTCGIGDGDLACTGQVKALVTTGAGLRTVETYAPQSAENWMEDYGTGIMQSGVSVVKIDPAFAETVSETADYHVFLTPNADCKGLYVINKTRASFEVRESGGGTSSLNFDYKIVAKRRGYEAQRLMDVTGRLPARLSEANQQTTVREPYAAVRSQNVKPRPAIAKPSQGPGARPAGGKTPAAEHGELGKMLQHEHRPEPVSLP
jgi:hypothetical protein